MTPSLSLINVTRNFPDNDGAVVRAVDGVSLDVYAGRTLGLVGESGCGKSTVARVAARLLEPTSGTITYSGADVTSLSQRAMRVHRHRVQMVFQDPYSSLDPRFDVARLLAEPMRIAGRSKQEIAGVLPNLLERVGLPAEALHRRPGAFSGGQRQRIGIARATSLSPEVLVLDEPVSALDASIQAQVLNLFRRLQQELGLGYLFIAHDLSVVRHMADDLAVMYLGRVVEQGPSERVLAEPQHPYTQALLSAVPIRHPRLRGRRDRIVLQGEIPSPSNPPSGCRFRTRCWRADDRCTAEDPRLSADWAADRSVDGHVVACHYPGDLQDAGLSSTA